MDENENQNIDWKALIYFRPLQLVVHEGPTRITSRATVRWAEENDPVRMTLIDTSGERHPLTWELSPEPPTSLDVLELCEIGRSTAHFVNAQLVGRQLPIRIKEYTLDLDGDGCVMQTADRPMSDLVCEEGFRPWELHLERRQYNASIPKDDWTIRIDLTATKPQMGCTTTAGLIGSLLKDLYPTKEVVIVDSENLPESRAIPLLTSRRRTWLRPLRVRLARWLLNLDDRIYGHNRANTIVIVDANLRPVEPFVTGRSKRIGANDHLESELKFTRTYNPLNAPK